MSSSLIWIVVSLVLLPVITFFFSTIYSKKIVSSFKKDSDGYIEEIKECLKGIKVKNNNSDYNCNGKVSQMQSISSQQSLPHNNPSIIDRASQTRDKSLTTQQSSPIKKTQDIQQSSQDIDVPIVPQQVSPIEKAQDIQQSSQDIDVPIVPQQVSPIDKSQDTQQYSQKTVTETNAQQVVTQQPQPVIPLQTQQQAKTVNKFIKIQDLSQIVLKLKTKGATYLEFNTASSIFEYSNYDNSRYILFVSENGKRYALPNQVSPFAKKQVSETAYKCNVDFVDYDNKIDLCIIDDGNMIIKQGMIF